MLARDLMRKAVETVAYNESVQRAAQLMRDENIGFLPVIDEHDRVVGIVTDRDIAVRAVAEALDAKSTEVAWVMTRELVACHPNDEIARVRERMARYEKSRVLVADEAGRLIGVISLSDVAGADPASAADILRQVANREVAGGHGHLLVP